MTFQTYIKQLIDKKIGVYACPTCLKIAGFKPEDIMVGVRLAPGEENNLLSNIFKQLVH